MEIADLRNEKYFPSFSQLPKAKTLDVVFYTSKDNTNYVPAQHWCLIAEIMDIQTRLHLKLTVKDAAGHVFHVILLAKTVPALA
jgi:hypothetical protein